MDEKKLENTPMERFQLFNIAEDPSEKKDVIGEHPEKAEELKAMLAQIIQEGRTRKIGNKQAAEAAK